jgi:hypothetical protein
MINKVVGFFSVRTLGRTAGSATEITAACRRSLRVWLRSWPAKTQLMPWVGGNGERS